MAFPLGDRVPMDSEFIMVLSDSLFSAYKGWGVHLRSLRDGRETVQVCHCVASGCSLMKPLDGRIKKRPQSAIAMAAHAMEGRKKEIREKLASDPVVRVLLLKAANSIAVCREYGEQFPELVAGRRRSRLMSRLETPWSICDLQDVVQQRPRKRKFAAVEACKLRLKDGFYDEEDTWHFRHDVAKQAEDEILKTIRRTARLRYGDSLKNGDILLVLAAGWNVSGDNYSSLDSAGKAFLRAELVAAAELCALDGHRVSAFRDKMHELLRRNRGSHKCFLRKSVHKIRSQKRSSSRRWMHAITKCSRKSKGL